MVLECHRVVEACEELSSHFASAFAVVSMKTVAGNVSVDEIPIESGGDFLETFEANLLLSIGDFEDMDGFWVDLQGFGERGLGHAQGCTGCADPA